MDILKLLKGYFLHKISAKMLYVISIMSNKHNEKYISKIISEQAWMTNIKGFVNLKYYLKRLFKYLRVLWPKC